jgi:preprotein translocase subunit SecE
LGVRVPPGLHEIQKETSMNKVTQYISDVKQEVAKVSWPRRDQLVNTTWVVLVICLIFAVFVFGLDIILSRLLKLIF